MSSAAPAKARSKAVSPPPPAPNWVSGSRSAIATEADADQRTIDQRVFDWLVSVTPKALLISLLLHCAALMIAGLVFISDPFENGLTTVAGFNREESESLDQLIDTSFEQLSGGMEVEQTTVPEFEPVRMEMELNEALAKADEALEVKTDSIGQGLGETAGNAAGLGKSEREELGLAKPGGNAITKGNFTAWTDPEDPKPLEPYVIFIEIKLPEKLRKKMKKYPKADLSGFVIGTDTYQQPVPGPGMPALPIKGNIVQLSVIVPGSYELVQDTIVIRSKMLKEQQILKLTF
ncbi:hypothetical protein [Stratiformator vulcanicus]|uniref:Uncharacterized protein n=1 Tax=Stratiformator vulcanicus TaxID=2527980 RepID=A0A517R6U7_9PLAN|nr:hypothetical protein [Stratiformator vulcanicus]QDT39585.1 hypothetical protein Pan189_39940 [Stratiformator vulcanicus]